MPVSVTYTAAAGLTQSHVDSASDVSFSVSDVAILPEVEAHGVVVEADEIATFGVTTLTGANGGAVDIVLGDGAQAGAEKVLIYTHDDSDTTVSDGDGTTYATLDQNGIALLLWDGSAWATVVSTATA